MPHPAQPSPIKAGAAATAGWSSCVSRHKGTFLDAEYKKPHSSDWDRRLDLDAGRHRLDLYEYSDYSRVLEIDELLAMFPEINEVAEVVPIRFRTLPSPSIQATDWLELNEKISEIVRDDLSLEGIVITHGTDTVEETAYFLHLTAKVDVPIVMVAAQRPPNGLGTDAGINIVNALRVASSPAARGMGVMLVMNDEIQCAREVTKTMNSRIDTFQNPDYGCLGKQIPSGILPFIASRSAVMRPIPNSICTACVTFRAWTSSTAMPALMALWSKS